MKISKLLLLGTLVLALCMAMPAFAAQILATKDSPAPNIYYVGDTIHYTMTVNNPVGNTEVVNTLTNIYDLLPNGTTHYFVGGDSVVPQLVQNPGDTETYTLDYVVAEVDLITIPQTSRIGVQNLFHADGTDTNSDPLTAEVSRNSRVIRPSITILKLVDCDNDGEYNPVETGSYGQTGHWRIIVTNTSPDSGLYNVMVSDTNGQNYGPFDLPDPDDSETFDYDTGLETQTITNTATVQALDELEGVVGPVSSTAINNVTITPGLTILKTVDCDDNGTYNPEESGPYGETGHWRIVVTNNGDSPITDILVTDDNGENYTIPLLNIGESDTHEYDTPGMTQTIVNTATAQGVDVFGGTVGPVTSTATNNIAIEPSLTILKTVDCDNDGTYHSVETGPYLETGHWRIVVTNNGDSPVTDIHVTDDNGEDYTIPLLNIGESNTHEYDTPGMTQTIVNTATAQGVDVFSGTVGPVTSTATNNIAIEPSLTILKTVDCDGDGTYNPVESGPYGETGHWRIVVTNNGDSPVTDIHVTDDNGEDYTIPLLNIGESNTHEYDTPGMTQTIVNTAAAQGVDVLGSTVGPVSSTATNVILYPDTTIDILANDSDGPITVCEGDIVTLTICESNNGQVDLTDPYVELYADTTLIGTFDETSDQFTGIDGVDLGELDQLETWCWDVDVIVSDPTTTFTAIGYGYLDGILVTWCETPTSPPADTICDQEEIDDVIVETEKCGGEGCTPGFWKNNGDKHDASAWDCFTPETKFSEVFDLVDTLIIRGKGKSTIEDPTLLEALGANGGGINAMVRHGVAAMLNACSDCVQYAIVDPGEVISMIEDTLNEEEEAYTVGELHSMFAEANESGCPVNQHGDCSHPN